MSNEPLDPSTEDDAQGHVAMRDVIRDEPGGRRVPGSAIEPGEDVEGHRHTASFDDAGPETGIQARSLTRRTTLSADDEDDVQGHGRQMM